jgi:hypothetical protein
MLVAVGAIAAVVGGGAMVGLGTAVGVGAHAASTSPVAVPAAMRRNSRRVSVLFELLVTI